MINTDHKESSLSDGLDDNVGFQEGGSTASSLHLSVLLRKKSHLHYILLLECGHCALALGLGMRLEVGPGYEVGG